jgi:hypothetical protein
MPTRPIKIEDEKTVRDPVRSHSIGTRTERGRSSWIPKGRALKVDETKTRPWLRRIGDEGTVLIDLKAFERQLRLREAADLDVWDEPTDPGLPPSPVRMVG